MKLKVIFTASLFLLSLAVTAKDDFTMFERQQVFIATPGLFDHSDAFTVDFAALRPSDYSFPLPVGKAELQPDHSVRITSAKGDAVKAMFAGKVRLSKSQTGHGFILVIRHDNGLETVYSHNAQNLVAVGDRVKAGQTVAIVGSEGGKTYCSFSIMVNGGRINPETIIGLKSHRLHRQTVLCRNAGSHVDISVTRAEKKEEKYSEVPADGKVFAKDGKHRINFAAFNPSEWSYPLPDAKVISNYGGRGGRKHTGVDIKTHAGDEILAAFDGTVTMSQNYAGYGKCIRIRHANGLETLYSHNSKNLVKVGDRVKAGQVIALVGQTGRATTAHLHFETRIDGQPFDPAKIFDHLNHSIRLEAVTFTKSGSRLTIKSDANYMAKQTSKQGKKNR